MTSSCPMDILSEDGDIDNAMTTYKSGEDECSKLIYEIDLESSKSSETSLHSLNISQCGLSCWNKSIKNENGGDASWNKAVSDHISITKFRHKIGIIIEDKYKVIESIAKGKQGSVYYGIDLETNEKVAFKFDHNCGANCSLTLEYQIYKKLNERKNTGIPRLLYFTFEYETPVLITELLGPSLQSLLSFCGGKFGFQTTISIGIQMLDRLQYIHSYGFVHRDLKPENFVIGLSDNENIIYLVDYGLSCSYKYIDDTTTTTNSNNVSKEIPCKKRKTIVGTANYVSLNTHNGYEISRRDDLESLCYILIEFFMGTLPWKKSALRNVSQNNDRIGESKEKMNIKEVCGAMENFYNYCKSLSFSDEPNYDYLKKCLRNLKYENSFFKDERDDMYTWIFKRENNVSCKNKFYLNFRWCSEVEYFDKQKENDVEIGVFGMDN
uniref:non-specific serine/threonine protein kinase n=1 Tax=Parastrongyloides trichosuri TaxID=131310 RepID=A0A0N4Z7A2_PARTI